MTDHAKCKITVIKKTVNQEIIDAYMKESMRSSRPCSTFQQGDEFFISSEFCMPKNFCHWAWADLRKDILAIINGVCYPWYDKKGMTIAGCTDWFRPVYFKIEKLPPLIAIDKKKFGAVLFDLDGTLVDFQWQLDKAIPEICAILSEAGIAMAIYGDVPTYAALFNITRDITDQWISAGAAQNAEKLLERLDGVYDRYDRDALKRWQPYPDTLPVLKALADAGYPMGVVSNCGRDVVNTVLNRFEMRPYFDLVLSRDDVSRIKPHPDSLLMAQKQMSLSPEKILFVGDSINDINAAEKAGMQPCFLFCGESLVTGQSSSHDVFQISCLSDLMKIA